MKVCNSCKIEQDESYFHRDSTKSDGLRTTCKSCKKHKDSLYSKANKDAITEKRKARYIKNRDRERQQQSEYARKNRERLNMLNSAYKRRHPGRVNYSTRSRQAQKLKATPAWADLQQIKKIYELCAKITEKTGIPHHVDHCIPLKGKYICGLHVENNLQILPAKMNIAKGNKYELGY